MLGTAARITDCLIGASHCVHTAHQNGFHITISHQLRHYNGVTKFAIEHGFSISSVRRPAFTEN
jgi:hypothetical protein